MDSYAYRGPWHFSRGWDRDPFVGTDECPCTPAACGGVAAVDPSCPQHAAGRTIREMHPAWACAAEDVAVGG
jgi:hypothetical protein